MPSRVCLRGVLAGVDLPRLLYQLRVHTQNISKETPGLFVDVLSPECLQNKH